MLNFLLGPSGSGKTTELYKQLKQRALAGQKSILLVPEQFTSSTEGRIYDTLGDAYSGMVDSFSFTTLAERLLRQCGGSAVQTLSDAGRVVLVRRALEQLGDQVQYYRRHRRSAAFCQMAAETIDELKSAGLTGDLLQKLAPRCGPGSAKLAELGLIFSGYEALLAQTGMDPADRLSLAADRLDEALSAGALPDFLAGRTIFIDEFDTFNAPKKRLMAALLRAAPAVTVALCADSYSIREEDTPADDCDTWEMDGGLFSGAKQVARQLTVLARRNGVPVNKPCILQKDWRHEKAPGLAALADFLATGTSPEQAVDGAILYPAESRQQEATAVAAAVARLARQGVRYRQMAVVCRSTSLYRAPLRYAFRLANIPLYCDEPIQPAFSAPAVAVQALLALCTGREFSQNMTTLAKTGLCALREEQVCALENYVYTWQPGVAAWREPFTHSLQGFGETRAPNSEEQRTLQNAEEARAFLMAPVQKLRRAAEKANAAALSRALYLCLLELGAEECQQRQVEQLRQQQGIPAAEAAAREWNVMMELLDQMSRLLGEEDTGPQSYAELLTLLLRASDLGHIPQSLDSVLFTAAGKMRLNDPDYVFVLGLVEGEFPATPGDIGLLTHADRDALIQKQVFLPDCFENRLVREEVCFYKALTAARQKLWLSWPQGEGCPLTARLKLIETLFQPAPSFTLAQLAPTPAAALDTLGARWATADGEALRAALQQSPEWAAPLAALQRAAAAQPRRLSHPQALLDLLRPELPISPSQLEKYYTCRYGYFLRYVLGLRPRQRAELSPSQSGTLMHWMLQMALEPDPDRNPYLSWQPAPFSQLTDEQLDELSHRLIAEYARLYLPAESARFAYLLDRIARSMTRLFCYLRNEQQQGGFLPVACEQRIGHGQDALPPQVYQLSNGRTAVLIGTVDRVDHWVDDQGDTWVRVVDYKTGSKDFSLKDVYCGLDCQMLLYLFSLTRDASGRPTGAKPAGVLYLLADPEPGSIANSREQAALPLEYDLQGLVSSQPPVYLAMDREATGQYVPFKFKNGTSSPSQTTWLADADKFSRIREHLDGLVTGMGEGLYQGDIDAEPLCVGDRDRDRPCQCCDYRPVCCHEDGVHERLLSAPKKPFEDPPQEKEDEA